MMTITSNTQRNLKYTKGLGSDGMANTLKHTKGLGSNGMAPAAPSPAVLGALDLPLVQLGHHLVDVLLRHRRRLTIHQAVRTAVEVGVPRLGGLVVLKRVGDLQAGVANVETKYIGQ